jgi:LPS-assembly lipoprotein
MVTTLAGCGFHLRGSDALPTEMSVTYIHSSDPFGSLVDNFADALRKVLSVNTSGKVLEYQLRQIIQFSVATAENLPIVEQQTVTMRRTYLYRSTDVLGSERERDAVRNTLQESLVNMAMLRIAAAAR